MDSLPIEAVVVVIGLVLFLNVLRLNDGWVKDARKMDQPMSITLKTSETPGDVAYKAGIANRNRGLLILGIWILLWAGLYRVNPTLAIDLFVYFLQLVIALFSFLAQVLFVIVEQIQTFLARLGEIG